MAIGGDDLPPGQWDDELSSWPEQRRRLAAKRIAFVTVCGVLVTLIILTIVFVGNDDASSARVAANQTASSGPSTTGFATSLPVAATATSLSNGPASTSTSTTTETTTTETTAPILEFEYNPPGPKIATSEFVPGSPACPPTPGEQFEFNTPTPGTLTIIRLASGITASGPVSQSGDFDITGTDGVDTERYVGNTTQTEATGSIIITNFNCTDESYSALWTFS